MLGLRGLDDRRLQRLDQLRCTNDTETGRNRIDRGDVQGHHQQHSAATGKVLMSFNVHTHVVLLLDYHPVRTRLLA